MSTRIASLIAFPLASLFAAGALAAAVVGQPAPAFSVKDIAGKTVSLADFKGKTVVLEWHNFGCPFVQKHYNSGNMQGMQKNFSGQVVWLAVNSTEPGHQDYVKPAAIRKKLNEMGAVPAAYLMDESGEMGKAYGAKVTPHMFIVDPSGKVVYNGAIDDKRSADVKDMRTANNFVFAALMDLKNGKPVAIASNAPYGCTIKYR
ncbi:MAG: thioredoxin family protein [Burkholderiales bacterium]|nr:thioredoxin family protein [Burkholderiales bacterium]